MILIAYGLKGCIYSYGLKIKFGLPTVINSIIQSKKATLQALTTNENWFELTFKEEKQIARQKDCSIN